MGVGVREGATVGVAEGTKIGVAVKVGKGVGVKIASVGVEVISSPFTSGVGNGEGTGGEIIVEGVSKT